MAAAQAGRRDDDSGADAPTSTPLIVAPQAAAPRDNGVWLFPWLLRGPIDARTTGSGVDAPTSTPVIVAPLAAAP